jgi:Zn-finger protein
MRRYNRYNLYEFFFSDQQKDNETKTKMTINKQIFFYICKKKRQKLKICYIQYLTLFFFLQTNNGIQGEKTNNIYNTKDFKIVLDYYYYQMMFDSLINVYH